MYIMLACVFLFTVFYDQEEEPMWHKVAGTLIFPFG